MIQELPLILQRLRKGMGMLGLDKEAQDAQIKIISDILAEAQREHLDANPRSAGCESESGGKLGRVSLGAGVFG